MSLLWLPYLSLGVVLIALAVASFCKYHFKYRGKYRKTIDIGNKQKAQKYIVTLNKNGSIGRFSSEINLHTFFNHKQPRLDTPDVAKMDKLHSWSKQNGVIKGNDSLDNIAIQDRNHISSICHQMSFDHNGLMLGVLDQPMDNYCSPSSYDMYDRQEEYSNVHTNRVDFCNHSSDPPTPPKRNLHNVNRFQKLHFLRNSYRRNSNKEWDSGYHSTSNHIKLEGSYRNETVSPQREREIVMKHDLNYRRYTDRLNLWEPSTLHFENCQLRYQRPVETPDRDDYSM